MPRRLHSSAKRLSPRMRLARALAHLDSGSWRCKFAAPKGYEGLNDIKKKSPWAGRVFFSGEEDDIEKSVLPTLECAWLCPVLG